ncbi:Acetyl-CoA carboxylase carboxyl transferase subunit beta [Candidatus Hepatincolaceae symbiont of Richtersius coronifer]
MNWIQNLKSKIVADEGNKKDIPDNLWTRCPACGTLLFNKDLAKNLFVCESCEYHLFLPIEQRLKMLFDEGQYLPITLPAGLENPLKFKDKEKYADRLKAYRFKSQQNDAIIAGYGKVKGVYTVIAVMNFHFMAGSMGTAVGEGIVAAIDHAILRNTSFVMITASGGARMQEGIYSLMQMVKITVAIEKLKKAHLPYLVILTNPTTGGVTASFAMIGDIHIAEKGATIGFAGARVIENTIRKKLPEGFQTSEYLLEHGMLDIVVHRNNLKSTLGNILDLLINKVK